ncbi:MAG: ribose-5-phosphate isomerase RpiA [Calditrichia bacterium]
MDQIQEFKTQAAKEAVTFLKSGMIVGLGTGNTATIAIKIISQLLQAEALEDIFGIPSSVKTARLAQELGIPLTSLEEHPEIDVTIDGADEVDPELNLIKGGGGALLKEKILAQASKEVIIVVDESKLSPKLGTKWALPVEVLPFAWKTEAFFLESLGAAAAIRKLSDETLYRTDQGNLIIDANFGEIQQPDALAQKLQERAGIIEHGLFIGLASMVISSGKSGIQKLTK